MFDPGIILSIQPRVDSTLTGVIACFVSDCDSVVSALRLEGAANILHKRKLTGAPIIGLIKETGAKLITPSHSLAKVCVDAGADYVAMECSKRVDTKEIEKAVNAGIKVIADVEDYAAALRAEEMGCVAITTALSGYIGFKTHPFSEPHFLTLESCVRAVSIPVIAEGRYRTAEHVAKARELGAHSVCVGNAIHDPYFAVQYLKLHFNGTWEQHKANGFTEIV